MTACSERTEVRIDDETTIVFGPTVSPEDRRLYLYYARMPLSLLRFLLECVKTAFPGGAHAASVAEFGSRMEPLLRAAPLDIKRQWQEYDVAQQPAAC